MGSSGSYTPGPTQPTPIDTGTAMMSAERIVFRGTKATREWRFDKLVGFEHSYDSAWTALQVSNRQRTSGIGYGAVAADDFRMRLDLALAVWRGDREGYVAALKAQFHS
ncbi:hypothetical protein [Glycomyces buryatensis]|uniref:Uncharacterized protein n=1 Tax=Glycomyces buryatensis TaxID=2570927 RepID=A0A4S8QMS1_9ACTN|nr:hypothetical protein [Glycomyces buryatensis]THV42024.1 hypothetical protein FAB82_08855 [Glycomyces buryatensis]